MYNASIGLDAPERSLRTANRFYQPRNFANEINQIRVHSNNHIPMPGIFQRVRSLRKENRRKSLTLLRCSVGSDISCIVIKSNRHSKKIPLSGETVTVADRPGLFVVMQVDHDRRVAQLMERSGKHQLIDVPFTSLRTFNRNLAQTIHRFLNSREDHPRKS